MKFAVLGLFGLLAVAAAYPYPEYPRYRPVSSHPERYPKPQATPDDNREFKGLVRALVQSMDDRPKSNHETPYSQPERMGVPDVPVPVHSREFNDLVSALSREERPVQPRTRAQEKLDRLNVQLQSHQQDLLNRVEEELAKHPDVKPGTPEFDALLKNIHAMFPHRVDKCPDGSEEVNCLQSPCETASCPAHPNATCKEDYCGGCGYYFVDVNESDKKYTPRDCYIMEDAGQKAYTAAKEVLAQHGKMGYDELLMKMHEKLDMPRIQTNHKHLDPSDPSYAPVYAQRQPQQSEPYNPYQSRRPAMPRYGNAEMAPRYGNMERRPAMPRYGNVEMAAPRGEDEEIAPRYNNMGKHRYPNPPYPPRG